MRFKLNQDVRIGSTVISEGEIIEVIEEKDKVASIDKKAYHTESGDINIHWEVERVVAQDGVDDFPSAHQNLIKDQVFDEIMKQLGESNHNEGDLQGVAMGLEYVGYWSMNRK